MTTGESRGLGFFRANSYEVGGWAALDSEDAIDRAMDLFDKPDGTTIAPITQQDIWEGLAAQGMSVEEQIEAARRLGLNIYE